MRITNELPPIARPTRTKTPETAAGDSFAALLAVAGRAVTANAEPTDGAAETPVAPDTTAGLGGAAGSETAGEPAETLLALGLLTPAFSGAGLPAGATETAAPANGVASPVAAATPGTLAADPGVTDAAESANAAGDAGPGGFSIDRLDITVEMGPSGTAGDAAGHTETTATALDRRAAAGPATTAPGAAAVADDAAVVPIADGRSSTDALDAAGPAANPTGPVHGSRTTMPSIAATDRPIPPSRLADVALAAARASSEADRPVKLTVRLDPPNLGEVRVELIARNGSVTVRVEPVHNAAAPLLAHQRDAVAAALERTGLSLSSFDVTPGEPERRHAPQSKRTVRIAELTATDGASTEPTAGRTGLRI